MNVKKQQMQLQLQQPQRRHDRTGFEALLDGPVPVAETSPPGGTSPWSTGVTDTAGRYNHPHYHRGPPATGAGLSDVPSDVTGSPTEADDATVAATAARPGRPQDEAVTTPPPPSPLSLPSPYYDRNPVIGFPVHHHHHHHHHHVPKSPPPITATVPLGNVQNVVYATGDQQDHNDLHHANSSKYYYQRHNYKLGGLTDGRDEDKENIKQRDTAECLQQQLDEVLQACVDYEERNKSRQQTQSESSGNTSPGNAASSTTTPPHQNRIKTNGSLPRDSKKSSTETSSPTSPLSPMTSPLSPMTSPLSPSSTWPSVTTPSPLTMSPLSLRAAGGDNDSVFLENDNLPSSSATCGSPRTRIRTLVPPCTTATEDLYSGKDHQLGQSQLNGHDGPDDGLKTSPTAADNFSSKSPDRQLQQMKSQSSQSPFLQSPPPPSWQTTKMWLRSSPFGADSKDGSMTTTPAVPFAAADKVAEAAEQRRKLLVELSAHKSRLVELHLRREEVDRELIIETALLRAELDVADDETRQSDNIVDGLDRAVADCRQKMDACTMKQQDQRIAADSQLAGHRQTLQGLRKQLESIEDNDVLKTEIRDSIDKQTELLDAEQKLYEDVEFGLLEEEAGWLARREELHRDRAAAVAVRRARRARAEWLRAQLDQLRSVGDDQLRALRTDINTATLSIQQGHKKLQDLDATVASTTTATNTISDQYRRPHQSNYEMHSAQPPKSLEWSWDQQLKSPISSRSPSSLSWDLQPSRSPWFSTATPVTEDTTANNINSLVTGSMTTTCCSSIGSSGGEDDGCTRPTSDDSISRMSMSTIFDGGATIKLRPKNKTSPSDITKRPLTRYLPIRYDGDGSTENRMAFDLRAHIESAGHQLDDDNGGVDRHFWIDSTSCRGYLKKLSGAGGKNARRGGRKWLKRWFVFDRRSRTLSYYRRRSEDGVDAANQRAGAASTEKKIPPRASIRFQDIQEVYVDHTNSTKGQGCAFVVKTAQRTFYLSAATGQAVRVWVDVIFTGAEGYREYLKDSTTKEGVGCRDGRR